MAVENTEILTNRVRTLIDSFERRALAGGSTGDAFLDLKDVKGSSTDKTHKDKIDVLCSLNFVCTTGGGPKESAGKVTPSDYYFVVPIDSVSTPVLYQMVASGKTASEATVFYRKATDGEQKEYLKVSMKGVRVSLFWETATANTSHPHVAVIALQAKEVKYEHGSTKGGWNFSDNTTAS